MIDYDQVLMADKYAFVERRSVGRKNPLAYALKTLFFTRIMFPKKVDCKYLFFRSLVREDYKTLFNSIASVVPDKNKVIVEDYLEGSKYPALRAIAVFMINIPKYYSFSANSIHQRFYLYCRLCTYYRHVVAIKKIKFKAVVLFADMQPVENLISQYFSKKGKLTITMQHGLYVDYGDYPTVNKINYLNQPSDYFLCWGEHTKSLIRQYHENTEIVVCGKPSVIFQKKSSLAPREFDYFTVILDQNVFEIQNRQMLRLMDEYSKATGLKMNVRFHPGNNKKTYRASGIDFTEGEAIEHSCFVVGHTSTMIYELLYCGIPTFKYSSDIPFVELPRELIFSNARELDNMVNGVLDYINIGRQYIELSEEESMRAYSAFFLSLGRLV